MAIRISVHTSGQSVTDQRQRDRRPAFERKAVDRRHQGLGDQVGAWSSSRPRITA